ncbi:phosphatidate cytidylyltransferase [Aquibacillus koreensis]|uniref:Phosphatidate cytidylyltransferase n=1 Tax=Aquibacillus koreensis TaxID=279446 RepID=A0A9X3WLE6_9BACI|nr:phosphatidate cytidylyltransferase [Aquibacillus koreensis]MCT2534556.1 phosphatidate cytidylyltransferase [Aquibacillus koreensis]MDC3421850.1 phosphatidate cytidylyltransferase [Aquibacillus koreensis]
MKQRIITAVIAILLFFPFVFYGGWPFEVIMYIIATIGVIELFRIRQTTSYPIPAFITLLLLWSLLYKDEYVFFITKTEMTLMVVLLLLSYTVLVKNKFTFNDAGFLVLSAVYVGLGFHYFMVTREANDGLTYIFYAIVVILATDTGAYFFGRAFGKRKLWPEISPNKTIEGALGGVLLACVAAFFFHMFFPLDKPTIIVILVTIVASAFAQIGDLVESAIKRHYDVKDSGKILPGHGGILDRFDSWLFVFPLLHFIHFIS